jgi:Kef-type K+ transport system membrane component KefB
MIILRIIVTFSVTYTVLLWCLIYVRPYIPERGFRASMFVLAIACAFAVCVDFSKRNRRFFEKMDLAKVVSGIVLVDFINWLYLFYFGLSDSTGEHLVKGIFMAAGGFTIFQTIFIIPAVIYAKKYAIKSGFIELQ